MFGLEPGTNLLLGVALCIVILVLLITWLRLDSGVALTFVALLTGLVSGLSPGVVITSFLNGVGGILSSIVVVIALGTMIGKLMAECGAASVVARGLAKLLGPQRLDWALMVTGFVTGLPVFFSVGLVILCPILFGLVRETGLPLLRLALPLLAGLSASHCLVPPHPGPMAAIAELKPDFAVTFGYSFLVGLIVAALGGIILGKRLASNTDVPMGQGLATQFTGGSTAKRSPGFVESLFIILLPLLLIFIGKFLSPLFSGVDIVTAFFQLFAEPVFALLVTFFVAYQRFGRRCGFSREELLQFTQSSLQPLGAIFLIIGAGGGFNRVLLQSGAGDAMAHLAREWPLSPLITAWLLAALFRVATGSATVAITTGAGVLVPILSQYPGTSRELAVVALGAGSMVLSHLNDGGFWLVKEFFNLSVKQALSTWTLMTSVMSVLGLVIVLLLAQIL